MPDDRDEIIAELHDAITIALGLLDVDDIEEARACLEAALGEDA